MIPIRAKITNGARQPHWAIIHTTSIGVSAPPSREPAWVTPCAQPRSDGSIQRDSERVAIGKAPASPMPNRKRMTIIEVAFHDTTVRAVKVDHHSTTPASALRGPNRSPSQPPGIWNIA